MILQNSQDVNDWRISILGKKCEVFWSPPTPTDDEFEADWYEAIVKRYEWKRNLFEVSFVGEEKRYFLRLDPTNTRVSSTSSHSLESVDQQQRDKERFEPHGTVDHHRTIVTPSSVRMENTTQTTHHRTSIKSTDLDTNWIQHVVGKEWEVFWQSNSTSSQPQDNVNDTNNVDTYDEDDESFYSDWYDAHILSFCPLTCTFQVSFVGEEDDLVHNMCLKPKDVRVAARSWVKRTLALLKLDGSTLWNHDGTLKKNYEIDMELPSKCIPWNEDECTATNGSASDKDEFDFEYYQQLLQDQLQTRSFLTFSTDMEDESKNKHPEENSQQHIDYLVECVQLVLDACRWYNENTPEQFYNRFLKSSNSKSDVADLYVCTIIGILKLIKASRMDLGRRRKKQICNTSTHSAKCDSNNSSTSRKRRKIKTNKRFDIYQDESKGSSGQSTISFDFDDLNIENLSNNLTACRDLWNQLISEKMKKDRVGISNLSKDLVCSVLSEYNPNSSAYFSQVITDCICQHHMYCWDSLTNWKQSARCVLGPKYIPRDNLLDVIDDKDIAKTSFSLVDMQKCLSESKSGDIIKFDMTCYIDALNQKMMDVFCFQKYAWDLVAKVEYTEIDASTSCDTDLIIRDLEKIKELPLCPSDSKNTKKEMTDFDLCVDLNINTIENAIVLRRWMLSCYRACSRRERVNEYAKLTETYPGKIRIPSKVHEKLGVKPASVLNILVSHLQTIQKKISEIKSRNVSTNDQGEVFQCKCGDESFITESEEKYAMIKSIKKWQTRVEGSGAIDSNVRVSTEVIDSLFNDLSSLQEGVCEERCLLVNDLVQNKHIDEIIAEFSNQYISRNVGMLKDRIASIHESSAIWRHKSDHVINTLINYGNDAIGKMSGIPMKGKQHIDLQYIEDLIYDHDNGNFIASPNIEILKHVVASCKTWSNQLAHFVPKMSEEGKIIFGSPMKQLENLQILSKSRPKGINMHPSKQIFSKWIDVLTWYRDCNIALNHISALHATKSEKSGEHTHVDIMEFTKANNLIEALISRGYGIISLFPSISASKSDIKNFKIIFSSNEHSFLKKYLEKRVDKALCTNGFTQDDINNSKSIILNMVRYEESLGIGGVFFKLQLYLWKALATSIMSQMGKKRSASFRGSIFQPTLVTATSILSHVEKFPRSPQDFQCSDPFIQSLYSSRIEPLRHLVIEASELESNCQDTLSYIDTFAGDITNEWISKALEDLRSIKRKLRSMNEFGLSVNSIHSTQIEKRVRDINWLSNAEIVTKKFSYDDESMSRIPFHSLNSMIDKALYLCKQSDNEMYSALSSTLHNTYRRLKKWHDECLEWLEQIKEFLPKSAAKGTQQRDIRSVYRLNESADKYSVVSEKVIENLLESDILKFVEMKEEKAVQESYKRTLELKKNMHEIFGIDHIGDDVDRMALPDRDSLLGLDGTFYFKRLTGSAEFEKWREKMNDVASSAEDLPVKTLEKITYDWMRDALQWIDNVSKSLKDPSSEHSPFEKIYLSSKDAEELVKDSTSLFFDGLTDDIKKYLSAHKVSISPRSGSGRVHVKNNKGGSIHSIGGTVLRWMAFVFNALQQDFIVSSQWTRLVKGYIAKQQSPDNENTLRTLFEQMQDLVVAPEEELVSQLLKRLEINNSSESTISTPKTVFVHQLLGNS